MATAAVVAAAFDPSVSSRLPATHSELAAKCKALTRLNIKGCVVTVHHFALMCRTESHCCTRTSSSCILCIALRCSSRVVG